ncbi:DUF2397 family protein [Actinomadura hibisca]|uniref:DUF2397 family protein n=1 Tax=Actinomadura hibisca TaxID=68565 RepID=UPI000A8BF109|nr:DUF2397 family protein [Actinomadura hibisca]
MEKPRLWWQAVYPSDWTVFSLSDDLARERNTALLAALEELSTRGPMADLDEVAAQMRSVGFHDPLSEHDLRIALDRLATAGLAEPFRDYTAPVRNYQGLIVRQEAWALTRKGRSVVAAVRTAVLDAGRALQLPSRLLVSVANTVTALVEHFGPERDHGLLPMDLNDVRTRIDELQRVTADFYTALAQLVQADVTDDALFGENRDRVIEALRQFPREYERGLAQVEQRLANLSKVGHRHIVEAAVAHAGLIDARDQHHWIEEQVRRLSDLEAWFVPDGTVQQLITSASGAVHTLLVAIDRRYSAHRRGSDLGADFHALARSLHRQASDEDARRVHAAAFGDWPAWHAVTPLSEEDVAHGTEAATSPNPRRIEVTLREHERQGRISGRPRKVPDTTAERDAALAQARAEAERRRRLTALLVTPGEVSLDHFNGLDAEAADALFRAVETALAQINSTTEAGTGRVDGANVLVEVRYGDTRLTRAALAEGGLTTRDLRICVMSAESAQSRNAVRSIA